MTPPEKPGLSVADFKSIAEAGATRSKLGRWLTANRDEFAEMLQVYRPRWDALVEKFIDGGLMQAPDGWPDDANARKRAVDAAKQIWRRTKARKLPQPVGRQPTPPPLAPPPASSRDPPTPSPPPSQFNTLSADDDDGPPKPLPKITKPTR